MDVWGSTVAGFVLSMLGAASGGPECLALVGLDLRRSIAWSTDSPEVLASLYVDDATAAPDVAALEEWSARGYRLESSMIEIGSCVATPAGPDEVRLSLVDRLAPTRAVDAAGVVTDLPRDGWSEREVVLRLVDGQWRYAAVSTP
jgi:hypothetical protein